MLLSENGVSIYGKVARPGFKVTVTTAGTRVQLSASTTEIAGFYIRPLSTNTGSIYLGDVTVAATAGFELSKNDGPIFIPANKFSTFYIDSAVNGESVTVYPI
jgi:hypothetical protein